MSEPEPRDPMWAAFHRAHPEVTLVLMPDESAAAGEGASNTPTPCVPREEANETLSTLSRRVALVAEVLQLDASPHAGWRIIDHDDVEPQVWLQAPVSDATPTDREVIAIRLEQLGWSPQVRHESPLVWVDAVARHDFIRVTLIDGVASIRSTGERLHVDSDTAAAMKADHDG